jgi:hypothetical protein
MVNEGKNRWYHDGYRARLNGKPRASNPRARREIWGGNGWIETRKYARWDEGWEMADNQIRGMTEWDQEQDLINELIKENADGD